MEKRFFLAITLSITVFLLWSHFFAPPPPVDPALQSSAEPIVISPVPSTEIPVPEPSTSHQESSLTETTPDLPEATPVPERRVMQIETDLVLAELDTLGGRIVSWKLKDYHGLENQPIELISPDDPLYFPGDLRVNNQTTFNETVFAADSDVSRIELNEANPSFSVSLSARLSTGEMVTKAFTFYYDRFMVNLDVTFANRSRSVLGGKIEYLIPDRLVEPLENSTTNRYIRSGPVFWDGHSRENPKTDKIQTQMIYPGVRWAALQESYFFSAIAPVSQLATGFVEPGRKQKESNKPETIVTGLIIDSPSISPGDAVTQRVLLLLGPKKYDHLQQIGIGIENIVDFGWIEFLGKFFYYILLSSVAYLKNYGLGIILITVGVKILLFPLSHKQMQSMKKMQAIQPQMKAIQEKYRKDPQKQQQELGMLYKKHGVNPMGGCLPMLVQFPVFIALYQVLMNLIEMRGAPFLWVDDLSQPNVILVLIMGASMVIQQKMTPVSGDPRQAKIMMMLPIIFTAMFWNFPAGLVLYWLTNNVLTITQQYVMNRLNKSNESTEPKMKARVRRKMEGRDGPAA